MDCERVQDLLSEFLDGSIPESGRADINAHIQECLPCRAAKEGLEETLLLLRGLPTAEAPPELLEGVRRGIARQEAPTAPLWKKLFLPAHIKIPLEAAAAVLLFLLVYGAQKEDAPKLLPPPPSARMDAPPAAEGGKERGAAEPAEKKARKAALPPRSHPLREAAVPDRPGAPLPQSAAQAQSSLPAVPAQLASTAGERIEPPPAAAPTSRVARPVPSGGEVTIQVAEENRPGLEERIAAAAMRLGGSPQGKPERTGAAGAEIEADSMIVHLPADSAKPFLAELSKLGTLPAEGLSGWTDLPAGLSREVAAYTVRIRVR
jgi:anti-sigma factor RsiW